MRNLYIFTAIFCSIILRSILWKHIDPGTQGFVYRKLLSSAPDIQQFAIDQFISLDNRVLVVSIQAELDKEEARNRASQGEFIGPNLPRQSPSQVRPSSASVRQLQSFPNNPFGQTSTDLRNLNPDKLTIAELVTLQVIFRIYRFIKLKTQLLISNQ